MTELKDMSQNTINLSTTGNKSPAATSIGSGSTIVSSSSNASSNHISVGNVGSDILAGNASGNQHQNQQQSEGYVQEAISYVKRAGHPRICVAHLGFKVVTIVAYFLGRYLHDVYVNTFVICVLFLAFDFWVVKNITGRLLVGLRWWNDVQDDGSSKWVFESHSDETKLDKVDREIFWKATYFWCTFWIVLFFINLISLDIKWLLLTMTGLAFSWSNLIGYWKCSKDAQKRLMETVSGTFQEGITKSLFQFSEGFVRFGGDHGNHAVVGGKNSSSSTQQQQPASDNKV